MFNTHTTKGLYIGKPEAEAESASNYLGNFFEDFLDIEGNINNGDFIISGRKGSGKSAYAMWILSRSSEKNQMWSTIVRKNEFDIEAMVQSIRNVEKAMGEVVYPADPSQIKGLEFSRSLYVAEDMKAGDLIAEQNVRSVRPGFGLHPKYLNEILGKPVNRDLKKEERMKFEYVGMEDVKCKMEYGI